MHGEWQWTVFHPWVLWGRQEQKREEYPGLWPFRTDFWVSLDPHYCTEFMTDRKACLWAPTAPLWFELQGTTAVSIVSQITVIRTDKTHWVLSLSQLRISLVLRRLSCFQQWGFRRFPARLLDRATHPLSGNPLVFNLKFPFASSFLSQLPLQSTLSKSFTIYIFQIVWHN